MGRNGCAKFRISIKSRRIFISGNSLVRRFPANRHGKIPEKKPVHFPQGRLQIYLASFAGARYLCAMFQLGKTIVSEDILQRRFVCNLTACHGACCVDGDAGAPLLESEKAILEEIYPEVKPFLRAEGIAAIENQGVWVIGADGTLETPLIDDKDCAYVIFDGNTALCGIEQAYNQGKISWKKPVSCHLYPIRVKDFSEFAAVNYDEWEICDPACALGAELEVPVYKFVREALVRRFGQDWYDELEKVAAELRNDK
jgi:hypothetical protein